MVWNVNRKPSEHRNVERGVDMERLTNRNEMGIAVLKIPDNCENCNDTIWTLHNLGNGNPIERLAHYEDLSEQGRLVELQCHCKDCIHSGQCTTDLRSIYCRWHRCYMSKEDFCGEAEQALAERKE